MEGEGYGWRFRGAWRGGHGADARTDANSRAKMVRRPWVSSEAGRRYFWARHNTHLP